MREGGVVELVSPSEVICSGGAETSPFVSGPRAMPPSHPLQPITAASIEILGPEPITHHKQVDLYPTGPFKASSGYLSPPESRTLLKAPNVDIQRHTCRGCSCEVLTLSGRPEKKYLKVNLDQSRFLPSSEGGDGGLSFSLCSLARLELAYLQLPVYIVQRTASIGFRFTSTTTGCVSISIVLMFLLL